MAWIVGGLIGVVAGIVGGLLATLVRGRRPGRAAWIASCLVLLLVVGGASGWYFRPNPEIARIKAMGDEFIEQAKESIAKGEMPFKRDDPRAKEFRDAMEKLTPEERRDVGMEMGLNFMDSMSTMIVAAPEPLRNFVLDKAIDQMEAERQRREERRAQAEAEGRDPGQAGGGPGGPGDGSRVDGDGMPRERRRPSAEEREKFMKKFLDKTKPDQRARIVLAFQYLDQRRKERGLPPMPWGGGGGRR